MDLVFSALQSVTGNRTPCTASPYTTPCLLPNAEHFGATGAESPTFLTELERLRGGYFAVERCDMDYLL